MVGSAGREEVRRGGRGAFAPVGDEDRRGEAEPTGGDYERGEVSRRGGAR